MARKKQNTMVLFEDVIESTKRLTDAQFGALMRGVFEYHFEGTEQAFDDPMVDMAFDFMKPQFQRYKELCEINRFNRTKKDTNVTDASPADNEEEQNATECNETKGNSTHNHTHNRTHTHNHNRTHTHTCNHNQKDIESMAGKPPAKTIPPTLEQVKQYCAAKGIGIDAQRFVDYYTANGWMVGRTKMKDWTAAVRTWNAKENNHGKTESQPLWTVGTTL